MTHNSTYHRILRISALVCAVVLLFESGLLSQTSAKMAHDTSVYLANAIGMSASVQPTELNTYTAALTQKERELDSREAALREREVAVNLSTDSNSSDTVTYILASILFVLLVLILLNYTLDYIRAKEARMSQTV
ncbi:hypothetical protein H6785_03675 [Candidatus Nomurabacteria bacterium]|nr:hypothetical protein [Candidatus Nomurabacteria bacterium]